MEHQHQHHRGQWGSNFGFLMATVGAAVGLGNIWAFPYKMGASGGFPFLLVYVILAALIGFPIMLSELAIGRKVGRSVIVSYQRLGGGVGTFIGWLAMLSPFLILSFYTVLGGYCMEYAALNLGELLGLSQLSHLSGAESFHNMLTDQPMALLFTFLFIAICFLIIRGGIKDGIERFNKVGMPALFVMLVIVIIRALTLPGAIDGLKFMFAPNFTMFKEDFLGVLSAAGGQMFFSLSLAMGITVTYGSYLSKQENLVKNSALIIISDTLVAILAGMGGAAPPPSLWAVPGRSWPDPSCCSSPFRTCSTPWALPVPCSGCCFICWSLWRPSPPPSALTEVMVTFFLDHAALKGHKPNRSRIVGLVCLAVMAVSTLVAVDGLGSNGLWVPFHQTGRNLAASWLDFMDFISEGVAMPLGALIMTLLVGWKIGPGTIRDEVMERDNPFSPRLYRFYIFAIRVIAPIGMAFILYGQLAQFFTVA